MTAYWKAVEAGRSPSLQEWIARYPHRAAELTEFFAGQAEVDRLAAPLRALLPSPPQPEPLHGDTAAPGRGDRGTSAETAPRRIGDYELR